MQNSGVPPPQSNGFVERQIRTAKSLFQKAEQDGTDKELALLCLRTTPINCNRPSPSMIVMGRKLRGNLPVRVQDSDLSNSDQVREELQNRQNSQKMYFDRRSKDLPPLIPGQDVRIQNSQSGQWEKAKVLSKCEEPRSYLVSTPEGQTYRRNRVHLRESPQPSPKKNVRFTDPCINISSPNHCHNEELNPNCDPTPVQEVFELGR